MTGEAASRQTAGTGGKIFPKPQTMLRLQPNLPRQVPWISWAHWRQVYHWLFGNQGVEKARVEVQDIRRGLARVNTWRLRGKVPVAVDATAFLLELRMQDREQGREQGKGTSATNRSAMEMRLSYSMAVTRFVNSVIDPEQRSVHAHSMTSLAKAIRLPRFFIDLRHDCSHNALPSLSVLRMALDKALDWLHTQVLCVLSLYEGLWLFFFCLCLCLDSASASISSDSLSVFASSSSSIILLCPIRSMQYNISQQTVLAQATGPI